MGGRRHFRAPRCRGCGLHEPLCACADCPLVWLRTRVLVIQNHHERGKPTNTGRLATLALSNSQLCDYGARGRAFDPSPLRGQACTLVFHRDEPQATLSPETSPVGADGRTLVFLDGTWAQCSRMSRRIEAVRELPCLALPEGPPPPWRGRRETHAARMSTMEAILRALELFEGTDAVAPVRRWFDLVSARLLAMKGLPPTPGSSPARERRESETQPPESTPIASGSLGESTSFPPRGVPSRSSEKR